MSEEWGSDYITITDEEGHEFELELLDTIEYDNSVYMAFVEADDGEEEKEPDYEMIILKVVEEDGEELLSTLDDDEELNTVYDKFMEHLFEDDAENEHKEIYEHTESTDGLAEKILGAKPEERAKPGEHDEYLHGKKK